MTGDEDQPSMRGRLLDSRPEPARGIAYTLDRALLDTRLFGAPPPTIGRFEVRRKLGQGGMSAVFEAWDPELARAVAVKVLRHDAALDVDIQREARALARLEDPAIVTIYDLGVEGDQLFLCMTLVEGGDLARWLDAHGPVSWRRLVAWFAEVARGLHVAHDAGIVHRDVKLENLLVGGAGRIHITDFGLARMDDRGPAVESDATQDGGPGTRIAGTPGYVAPEVLAGAPPSALGDQWSFWTTLDRALAHAAAPAPTSLRDLVERGLSVDPAARFQDLGVVEVELRALLDEDLLVGDRVRSLLARRVQSVWLDGVRDGAVATFGRVLPVRSVTAPDLGPTTAVPWPAEGGGPRDIAGVLERLSAAVLLVGAPGSGKTIQLLEVASALLDGATSDPEAVLPVVLNLSSFTGGRRTVRGWLEDELVAKYALPRQQVVRWVESGRIALLLDGLDELAADRRNAFVQSLRTLRNDVPLPTLVACREDEAARLSPDLSADLALRLAPLDPDWVARTVAQDTTHRADFVEALSSDPALGEQLRNPLVLALFLTQREAFGSSQGSGPLRARLYEAALHHALDADPAIPAELRADTITRWRWLAARLEKLGVTELWLEELTPAWLPSRGARWATWGVAVGLAFAGSYAVNVPAAWAGGQPTSLGLVWGTASAGSAFAINRGLRIVPMEAMGWSWRRFWTWVPFNVGMGVLAGYANSWISGEAAADMILGGVTGLLGMSMIGLTPQGRARRIRPNEGMRESIRNACMVAPLVGLLLFVGIGYGAVPLVTPMTDPSSMYQTFDDPGFTWGLTMGVAGGYATWLATGMWAPLAHLVVRLALAWTTPLPFALGEWLDDAARRDILRRVGGGWMFRHETFRAWLARWAPSGGPEPRPPDLTNLDAVADGLDPGGEQLANAS